MTHNLKVVLLTSAYAVDLAAHQFVSDLGVLSRQVARSPNLTGKTITDGVLNCDVITFPAVTGSPYTQYILFRDTGTDSSSPLMLHIDAASGLPGTPSGVDIVLTPDPGSHHMFEL